MDPAAGQLNHTENYAAALLSVIVGMTLGISFFCSLCEASLYAVSNARVMQLAHGGSHRGRRLKMLRDDIEKPIAAILALNTIANTAGATLAGSYAASMFDSWGVGIFSGLFTLGILYMSEIIPKTMGVLYADSIAPYLATPILWTIRGLFPLVWVCQMVAKLFPKGKEQYGHTSEADLLTLAQHGARAGSLRADEARWMQNALKLDELKVSNVLTPRTVVFSVPREMTIVEAGKEVSDWPHSRVPVTEGGDLDKVCGIVLQRDVYNAVVNGKTKGTLETLMRDVIIVPEGMRLGDMLARALKERMHLFVVGDEYGGTVGVVSLEDAIESLLGTEIVDEFDRDTDLQQVAKRLADERLRTPHANAAEQDRLDSDGNAR